MELSVDNIPFVSMAMAQQNLLSAVGTQVLDSTLEVASTELADLTKAMELSVNPNVGANFDVAI